MHLQARDAEGLLLRGDRGGPHAQRLVRLHRPGGQLGRGFLARRVPAVCNDTTNTQQDYAKAYPTIRELELAHLLGQVSGANEGIISSIARFTRRRRATATRSSGYRPAMNALVNRMKAAL